MSTGETTQSQLEQTPVVREAAPSSANELRSFFQSHLRELCRLVGGIAGVVYLASTPERRAGLAGRYLEDPSCPEALSDETLRSLEGLGRRLVGGDAPQHRTGGIAEPLALPDRSGIYQPEPMHRVLGAPLVAEGRVEGACLLIVPAASGIAEDEALTRLTLAGRRFEAFLWRQQCMREATQKLHLRQTLELLDAAQQGADAEAVASLLCHELARRFGCTRVSIGLVRGDRVRLAAVSSADQIDRKGETTEVLEAAMEECADQDIEVVYPAPPEHEQNPANRRVCRAHDSLSRRYGPSAILSLPLRLEGDLVGVMTLEREADDPFPLPSVPLLRLVAEFVGPAVWTRRLADRGILAVTRDRVLDLGAAIVGPRHTGAKLVGLVVIILLGALAAVPIPARVSSPCEVRASAARVLVPPFTGYLAEALVRPGDRIAAGQVLGRMDTTDLELELTELESQRANLATQRDNAYARRESAQVRGFEAAIAEVDAKIDRLRSQIDRAEMRAPIAGTVSRGDLDDFIGARVDPTQPLFEVIAPERIIVIQVDERDVGNVTPGQKGAFRTAALPEVEIPVQITRINPVAEAVKGANVYLAEAEVLESGVALDPGMTGTAKLEAGWTTGLGVILGPVIDELRLRMWW